MKNKYIITADLIEYLQPQEIEAFSEDEAKEKFMELWENGSIYANNSEFNFKDISLINIKFKKNVN